MISSFFSAVASWALIRIASAVKVVVSSATNAAGDDDPMLGLGPLLDDGPLAQFGLGIPALHVGSGKFLAELLPVLFDGQGIEI